MDVLRPVTDCDISLMSNEGFLKTEKRRAVSWWINYFLSREQMYISLHNIDPNLDDSLRLNQIDRIYNITHCVR